MNIKRVVAREGLILLSIILFFVAYLFVKLPDNWFFNELIPVIVIIGYLLYLYLRFIIWVIKKNKVDVKQLKISWYNNPQYIYCFVFFLTILAIPLVWTTPFITKNRKILFSLATLLYIVTSFVGRFRLWGLLYFLIAVLWFYKTEKNPKLTS